MLLLLFVGSMVFSQTKKISGKVTGSDGQPVPGATVAVKGTNAVTVTAADGTYTINAKSGDALVITSVGFKTQEIKVGTSDAINASMVTATSNLDEVVVTGYTSQKVKEITGSVAVVKPKDLTAVPAGQVEQMLQGRVAGLNVMTSGQPGAPANISLHGIGNFGDVTPLYIIDGVQGDINNLNPQDIESLQVLKDAGAASIYGVRGANGVIVITTKKGRSGRPIITYDGYFGHTVPLSKGFPLLNSKEMADATWQAYINSGQVDSVTGNPSHPEYGSGATPVLPDYILAGGASGLFNGDPAVNPDLYNVDYGAGPIYQIVQANKQGTDWFHEVFKPANQQSHTVTAAGGSDKSKYLISLGYLNQQGTMLFTYLKRYTVRANTEFNIKNTVRVGENIQLVARENPQIGNQSEGNEITNAQNLQPIVPVYDIKGGWGGAQGARLGNASNPVASRYRSKDDRGTTWQIFGNVYADVDFLKNFTFHTSFGGTQSNYYYYFFGFHTYENAEDNGSNSFNEVSGYSRSWTWTNTLAYNKVFSNDHSVKALIGTEALSNYNRELGGSRINYFTDDPNYRFLSTGNPTGQSNYSFAGQSTIQSYFGRIDYAYKDKYLLSGTIRRDGSSIFGSENRYGTFPSVSAAWRVTEENFAKGITWLTDLKVRGSWGKLGFYGNTNSLNQYTTYSGSPGTTNYDISGASTSSVVGFSNNRIGNAATGWQTDVVSNFGIEANLWKGGLYFTADWYKKKSEGLLFQLALPYILGGATAPNINIGDVQNTGLDLLIGTRGVISKDWKYDVTATITTYNNKVVKLNEGVPYFDAGGSRIGNFVRNQVGQAVSSFFGYKIVGFFNSADDVTKSPTQDGAGVGRFKYQDTDGDGKITDADRVFFGNPNPDFSLGLNLAITWKQFDFSTFFYGTFGNDLINYTRWWTDFFPSFQNAKSKTLLYDAWTPSHQNAKVSINENVSNFSNNAIVNSYYLEDGSYFKNKSMILGWTLPKAWVSKANIDRVRVYVQGVNLFTFTKYTGLDPELSGAIDGNTGRPSTGAFGIDFGNYPNNQKQYIIGLNVGF